MLQGADMITGLTDLPKYEPEESIKLKRVFTGEKGLVLNFIKENFQSSRVYEAENFYRKTIGAEYIKGGNPESSVYANMICM